jgi:hypothetical protein
MALIITKIKYTSRPRPDGLWAHPASYTTGIGSLSPGVKRPGRGVNRGYCKTRTIPILPLWAFMACSRVNFTCNFN